jgi:recombinational DNA repair protein (RecF pathway)
MSYKTYITDALVCGARASNTSDKSFLLFTREAGMLYASAKSVREERSKQRYALQEFSHIRVTLVRGKSGWKITGTEPLGSVYERSTRVGRAYVRSIVRLLRTYVHGEEIARELYDECMAALIISDEELTEYSEVVISLRMLAMLGYIPLRPDIVRLIESPLREISHDITVSEAEVARTLIRQASHESHLS